MLLAVIEWGQIFRIIWVSLLFGVGVSVLFAVAIYGSSRATETRRTGEGPTTAFGAVAVVALVSFAAIVVYAISVILQKS